MRIKIRKEVLEDAVSKSSCALGLKNDDCITKCFGIEADSKGLQIVANRRDISARAFVPCGDDLEIVSYGKIVIDGDLILDGISKFHTGVLIDILLEKDDSEESSGKIVCSYTTKNNKDWDHEFALVDSKFFPKIDFTWDSKHKVKYPADKFVSCVSKTAFAASTEETQRRYSVISLSFEEDGLVAFASDGRQLAHFEDSGFSFDEQKQTLLDAAIASQICKKKIFDMTADIDIYIEEDEDKARMKLEQDNLIVISNLVSDVESLPFRKVVNCPGHTCSFEINLRDLKEDMNALSSSESKNSVWKIGSDSINITNMSTSTKKASGNVNVANFDGKECEMKFNLKYWENLIAVAGDSDVVSVEIMSPSLPVRIKVNTKPELYNFYIMPIEDADVE